MTDSSGPDPHSHVLILRVFLGRFIRNAVAPIDHIVLQHEYDIKKQRNGAETEFCRIAKNFFPVICK